MTSFTGLSRVLSADEMAERGARKISVVAPGELTPDWSIAGRRLAEKGAGNKPKIHHLSPAGGGLRMLQADAQAALALAQRAADQSGVPQGAVPQFALTLLRWDRGADHPYFHERDLGDHLP
jgi:hypothetical protein